MNRRKKILLATLPALALVVLGASVTSAHSRMLRDLTEEQRAAIAEARTLFKEGNDEEAKEVLKGAGLPPLPPKFHKMHGHQEGIERHHAIREAVNANDFEAFQEAMMGTPFADMVTEENFAKLVEAHGLMENGEFEKAHELLEGLGFPHPGGHRMHHMHHEGEEE
jgi:hypothetical protein